LRFNATRDSVAHEGRQPGETARETARDRERQRETARDILGLVLVVADPLNPFIPPILISIRFPFNAKRNENACCFWSESRCKTRDVSSRPAGHIYHHLKRVKSSLFACLLKYNWSATSDTGYSMEKRSPPRFHFFLSSSTLYIILLRTLTQSPRCSSESSCFFPPQIVHGF
jgi:hypothetical protein